jgi:hypothetical protein
MAKPSPAALQQAKEAKQKKLLLVLLPFFLILVAWQGPKMYKQLFAAPAPETAPATTTAPAITAAATPAPGAAVAPASALTESEPPAAAGTDQLESLSRFQARNPFVPVGGAAASPTTGAKAGVTSAEIDVNGVSETVTVNGTFPAADPVFQLISVSEASVVIGLTTGSFDSGEGTVQIALGERVELVADDGATYTVTLASIG